MRSERAPPRGFGRMRREHELQRDSLRRVRQHVRWNVAQLLEGVGQGLARDALLVLVLAPAAHAMVLLREVRELEVGAERAQDLRLRLEVERADGCGQLLA